MIIVFWQPKRRYICVIVYYLNNEIIYCIFVNFYIFYNSSLIGCEVCGCGAGATYFGLQPNLARNFVGIRWRTMDLISHLGMGERFRTQEIFHTAELLARWYPLDRLQALISVPYSANTQYTKQEISI
ncbi:MAG: hypothetical protein IPK11_15380 [Ignavibacteria bacterium]|nr:hypothetical protein [Ignavibacteria bacterium]